MKVMVTGGTGFIGSYVVAELLAAGIEVTVLARNPAKVAGFVGHPAVEFVEGALANQCARRKALRGVDACIHIARGAGANASEVLLADTLPAVQLFEDVLESGAAQVIYTSSVAVFDGRHERLNAASPQRPLSIYGASKAAAEAYLLGIATERRVRANVIRPGYTFGEPVVSGAPTQSMSEIPAMVGAALSGERIQVVKGTGLQFIWAGDLARVYVSVLQSSVDRQQYIALSHDFHTWETVAGWIIEQVGSKSPVEVVESAPSARNAKRKEGGSTPWDVSAIGDDFGLAFAAEGHLRRHLDYWIGRLRS